MTSHNKQHGGLHVVLRECIYGSFILKKIPNLKKMVVWWFDSCSELCWSIQFENPAPLARCASDILSLFILRSFLHFSQIGGLHTEWRCLIALRYI